MSVSEKVDLDMDDQSTHIIAGKGHWESGQTVCRFGAITAPLTALPDKAEAPQTIHLLSLDVEGAKV